MNQRQMIAAVLEKLNIKLDENDPAFVLVELNRLALDEAGQRVADRLACIPLQIEIAVANSVLELKFASTEIYNQRMATEVLSDTQQDLLDETQRKFKDWAEEAISKMDVSILKFNSDIHASNLAREQQLGLLEGNLKKLYKAQAEFETQQVNFERERRTFEELGLFDRIFFKA